MNPYIRQARRLQEREERRAIYFRANPLVGNPLNIERRPCLNKVEPRTGALIAPRAYRRARMFGRA